MVTSVRPILANVERPKPRKMSPIPQIAKLTTSTLTTSPMMDLPSQPEEACRRPRSMDLPCCEQMGFRVASASRRRRIIGRACRRRNTGLPGRLGGAGLCGAALLGASERQKAGIRHGKCAAPAHCGQLEDEWLAAVGDGTLKH